MCAVLSPCPSTGAPSSPMYYTCPIAFALPTRLNLSPPSSTTPLSHQSPTILAQPESCWHRPGGYPVPMECLAGRVNLSSYASSPLRIIPFAPLPRSLSRMTCKPSASPSKLHTILSMPSSLSTIREAFSPPATLISPCSATQTAPILTTNIAPSTPHKFPQPRIPVLAIMQEYMIPSSTTRSPQHVTLLSSRSA